MLGVDVGHSEADVVYAGRIAGQRDVSRLRGGPGCRLEDVENRVARLQAAALTLLEVELEPQLLVEVDSPRVIGDRNTDVVEKFAVRVDVTEEFPFLVTKLSPYFDR